MPPPSRADTFEVQGMFFFLDQTEGEDEDEVWLWNEAQKLWFALPIMPPYLAIVRGKLALIDVKTMRPKCNCGSYQVNNFGCLCGGV